ncbi:MAG: MarC family protein [Bdellovibrionota bacterium]
MPYHTCFVDFFLFSFLALFPIINPIGMSSFFLQITNNYSKKEKRQLAFRVAKYSTYLLIIVLLTGSSILHFFGVSLDFIRIAGGLLVAWSAWRSLNNTSPTGKEEAREVDHGLSNVAFFPLTMPLTAGPGAIAVTIALDTRIEQKFSVVGIFEYLGIILGIAVVSFFVWFCYAFAEDIFNIIGKTGAKAITSISSMIILAIGVGIFWQGLSPLLQALIHKTP